MVFKSALKLAVKANSTGAEGIFGWLRSIFVVFRGIIAAGKPPGGRWFLFIVAGSRFSLIVSGKQQMGAKYYITRGS